MSSLRVELALDSGRNPRTLGRFLQVGPSGSSRRYKARLKAVAAEHGFHTASSAAEVLGVTPQCVAKWCRRGLLKSFQPMHEHWIGPDDLRAFALARGYPDPLGVYAPVPRFKRPWFCTAHYIERFQRRVIWLSPHTIMTRTQAALQRLPYDTRGWVSLQVAGQPVYLRLEAGCNGDWPAVTTCYAPEMFARRSRKTPGRFSFVSLD